MLVIKWRAVLSCSFCATEADVSVTWNGGQVLPCELPKGWEGVAHRFEAACPRCAPEVLGLSFEEQCNKAIKFQVTR